MSQKLPMRKSAINEDKDKEKRQTDSPVKEIKKKMAAHTEKEKHATEKEKHAAEKEKHAAEKEKHAAEKVKYATEKVKHAAEKEKHAAEKEKHAAEKEKHAAEKEKHTAEKSEKSEKPADKTIEKNVDKVDKKTEKKDTQVEKQKEESHKGEKSGKNEKSETDKPKQNGNPKVHNGVTDVTLSANGGTDELNGTVSADSDDDDVMLVIDDDEQDQELFPELTYDDTSDVECFESPTPENVPSRSFTRRSQVKVTRTPETPRPASDKQADKDTNEDPKDSKVLKLKDEAPPSDRKLRSADSPKRQEVKQTLEQAKKQDKLQDSPKKDQDKPDDDETKSEQDNKIVEESSKNSEKVKASEVNKNQEQVVESIVTIIEVIQDSKDNKNKIDTADKVEMTQAEKSEDKTEKIEMEVVVEVEADEEPRKTDTNYSKSRVKVSPYRRSTRIADQTATSIMANYTGNNTTMEMDITETSSFISDEGASLDDSSYLRGLRAIRGRSSYKPLKEITLKHLANRSQRSVNTSVDSQRPTGTVVGRKRKPDSEREEPPEGAAAGAADAADAAEALSHAHTKRMRLLDRIAHPFRRTVPMHLPRRPAEIVGINTDLPLTAPVASPDTFDPESLKPSPLAPHLTPTAQEPIATPLSHEERDSKRCVVM